MSKYEIEMELEVLKGKYSVLSEVWIPKSKHKTHLKISKMMDDCLNKMKLIENKLKTL